MNISNYVKIVLLLSNCYTRWVVYHIQFLDLFVCGHTYPIKCYIAGFELHGEFNRKDYGLTWNGLTPAGGIVVGENIKIHIDLELIKVL